MLVGDGVGSWPRPDGSGSVRSNARAEAGGTPAAVRDHAASEARQPRFAVQRALPFFCEHILKSHIVEREVGDNLLEPPILVFKVLEAFDFADL